MFDWYYTLRLWYWWYYIMDEDEFSPELGYWLIRQRQLKRYPNSTSVDALNMTVIRQRNIAHELDLGTMKVSDFSRFQIENARI